MKKCIPKTFSNLTGKLLCRNLILINLQAFMTPTQGFSCEIYEIYKNAFFEEHLRRAASIYLSLQ